LRLVVVATKRANLRVQLGTRSRQPALAEELGRGDAVLEAVVARMGGKAAAEADRAVDRVVEAHELDEQLAGLVEDDPRLEAVAAAPRSGAAAAGALAPVEVEDGQGVLPVLDVARRIVRPPPRAA